MSASTAGAGVVAVVLALGGCSASDASTAATTDEPAQPGPQLTAEPAQGLTGPTKVAVRGVGYDRSKGIYVAFCVRPAPGQAPTPCGGGVNRSGGGSASHWISSNPPPYGRGLATPFGPDGSFDVRLTVTPTIGDIDCRVTECVIATRADHTRSSDRTADIFVAVTFEKEDR